jgi:hypothetical protein
VLGLDGYEGVAGRYCACDPLNQIDDCQARVEAELERDPEPFLARYEELGCDTCENASACWDTASLCTAAGEACSVGAECCGVTDGAGCCLQEDGSAACCGACTTCNAASRAKGGKLDVCAASFDEDSLALNLWGCICVDNAERCATECASTCEGAVGFTSECVRCMVDAQQCGNLVGFCQKEQT